MEQTLRQQGYPKLKRAGRGLMWRYLKKLYLAGEPVQPKRYRRRRFPTRYSSPFASGASTPTTAASSSTTPWSSCSTNCWWSRPSRGPGTPTTMAWRSRRTERWGESTGATGTSRPRMPRRSRPSTNSTSTRISISIGPVGRPSGWRAEGQGQDDLSLVRDAVGDRAATAGHCRIPEGGSHHRGAEPAGARSARPRLRARYAGGQAQALRQLPPQTQRMKEESGGNAGPPRQPVFYLFRKEARPRIASLPRSGSFFNEKMLGPPTAHGRTGDAHRNTTG